MMNVDEIVCACNQVKVGNVIGFLEANAFPKNEEDVDTLCDSLEIGNRCGKCLRTPCRIIDISITDILRQY